jgi:probable F420-dependent oxidoreductase
MIQLAAERTAGAFTYFVTDDHTRRARRLVGDNAFLAVDLPVILESNAERALAIGGRYTSRYLKVDNYRHSLRDLGFSEEDIEPPGSPRLFDALVAWGTPGRIAEKVRSRLDAGADHVVLNIATDDPRLPYDKELAELAPVAKLG